ncbi:MAG TPA: archaetidylserine decarboxylase [Spongiibacteraceae bacterium]
MQALFIAGQYLLPQHLLSRWIGRIAESETPWVKNTFINWFVRRYNVDMSEAENADPLSYRNFNAFFTRALRADARPLATIANSIVCPADGSVSQAGRIESGRILQAKGQWYSALELIGGDETVAAAFNEGHFATIYLSPRDYHRVHMPVGGKLERMIYVPGDLFSVNQTTADNVPRLFARNERLVCIFSTDCGPVAVILVGAMIVAAIETVWAGQIAPAIAHDKVRNEAASAPVQLDKGAEMGRFKLGSTVVLLFGKDAVTWSEALTVGNTVRMGQQIGTQR